MSQYLLPELFPSYHERHSVGGATRRRCGGAQFGCDFWLEWGLASYLGPLIFAFLSVLVVFFVALIYLLAEGEVGVRLCFSPCPPQMP